MSSLYLIERFLEGVELRLRDAHFGFTDLGEIAGRDVSSEKPDDRNDDEQFEQRETARTAQHHMPPLGGVVAMVAPEGGGTGMSPPGGNVGIVLTVGGSTGISALGGKMGMAPGAGCPGEAFEGATGALPTDGVEVSEPGGLEGIPPTGTPPPALPAAGAFATLLPGGEDSPGVPGGATGPVLAIGCC